MGLKITKNIKKHQNCSFWGLRIRAILKIVIFVIFCSKTGSLVELKMTKNTKKDQKCLNNIAQDKGNFENSDFL